MSVDFPGLGTVLNVATVLVGSVLGMAVGHRLPHHTRSVVTDVLGLVTLLVAGLSAVARDRPRAAAAPSASGLPGAHRARVAAASVASPARCCASRTASRAWPARIQARWARHRRWADADERGADHAARERFIEGWLTASLLFCVGPLTILGSLIDGLGRGIDQLALKSVLDGFAAMAFAASFGVGVLFSAVVGRSSSRAC